MIKIKTACGYKINVNLDITTTLASGYHNIDSMFLRLQKGDQLEFARPVYLCFGLVVSHQLLIFADT